MLQLWILNLLHFYFSLVTYVALFRPGTENIFELLGPRSTKFQN